MADKTTSAEGVEGCLKELRKILPGHPTSIEFHDFSGIEGLEDNGYVRACCGGVQGVGASLSEAMAQVRAWHAEQAKKES